MLRPLGSFRNSWQDPSKDRVPWATKFARAQRHGQAGLAHGTQADATDLEKLRPLSATTDISTERGASRRRMTQVMTHGWSIGSRYRPRPFC